MKEFFVTNAPTVIVVAGIVILGLALMGWRIVISKAGLRTERATAPFKELSHHATCPHRMPIISLIRKVFYAGKFFGQYPFDVLHQQMDAYDEYESEVYSFLLDAFSDLLSSNNVDDPENDHDFFEFEKIMKLVLDDSEASVRKWFRSNHYAEKNPDEQAEYINVKRELIVQNALRMLKRSWNGETITKSELVDMLEDKKTKWYNRIEGLFRTAFNIARDNYRIRKETFLSITKECEELFGESSNILTESDL